MAKKCTLCGEDKELSEYYVYRYKDRNDVVYARCKVCVSGKTKATYRPWNEDQSPEAQQERKREIRRRNYRKIKEQLFDAYGRICKCCGETEEAFLTFDHINNDGAAHRKQFGNGKGRGDNTAVYRDLINKGFPDWVQVLCYNCNCAKQFSGVCPHTLKGSL